MQNKNTFAGRLGKVKTYFFGYLLVKPISLLVLDNKAFYSNSALEKEE